MMSINHPTGRIAALAIATVPLPAAADGLGGLGAVSFLMFIFLAPFALLGIVLAFVLRAAQKTRAATILGRINVAVCLLLLLFARGVQGRSLVDAFNPWWNTDDAVIVTICLALVVGNLFFVIRTLAGRRIIVAGLFVFLAIQLVGTAGYSINYEYDSLVGDVTSVRTLDLHHAESQGRVYRYEAEVDCCHTIDQAVIERESGDSWRIVWARPNKDPRETARRQYGKTTKWEFRFPFQPSHVARVLVEGATLLDEDWEAADDMLLEVARARATEDWIEQVVSRGADPNLRLSGGDTMLHRAVRKLTDTSDDRVVRLLRIGVDPTIMNDRGETAVQTAEFSLRQVFANSQKRREAQLIVDRLNTAADSASH